MTTGPIIVAFNLVRGENSMRIGVDLGGTKIEAIALRGEREIALRKRVQTPQGSYEGTLDAIVALIATIEQELGRRDLPVGVGHPGSISPASGLIRNANSTCLNGMPLKQDLEARLRRELRLANDADCLAVSEAVDGAAAGARSVFAAILGTGCGGGWVIDGQLLMGPNAIAGEWGHNPLPWPRPEWGELPGPVCWHGLSGCQETWISGSALAADHARVAGEQLSSEEVVARAERGDAMAAATLARYEDRLARALAAIINVMDPEVIVLGGGVSRVDRIYQNVPKLWRHWIFSDHVVTRLVPALHGDSSGVRGAARLWN
jgi:fructokinase